MRQLLRFIFNSPQGFITDVFKKTSGFSIFSNYVSPQRPLISRFMPIYILQLQNHLHTNRSKSFKNANGRSTTNNPEANAIRKILAQRKARRQQIREAILLHQKKFRKDVQDVLADRKIKLQDTEKKIRAKGKMIIQDIKETKEKMKEKMEEIIEVRFLSF